MALIRLAYFSQALKDMSLLDIQNILETARSNNKNLNICGMLCYESKWFLQALEGEREAVNDLFLKIADDPRHEGIVILSYEYIDKCYFSDWQMGYAGSSGDFESALKQFDLGSFEPPKMSPEQGFEFLKIMSERQNSN